MTAVVAGLLRFWQLGSIPPGLHYDKAFNALNALRVARGQIAPIYFLENNGEEPLHIYLTAGLFRWLGPLLIGGRPVSAGLGVAAVVALYFAAVELFRDLGAAKARRLGLLCSLFLATWYWHFHYSRIGMEPITVPIVALPAVLFAWRTFRTRSWLDAALGGAFTGLGFYTYPAGRAIPIVVGAIVAYHILARGRSGWRSSATLGGLIAITALAVFLPLGLFWWKNPTWFALRMQQVTERTLSEGAGSPAAHILDGVGKNRPRPFLAGRPELAAEPAWPPRVRCAPIRLLRRRPRSVPKTRA